MRLHRLIAIILLIESRGVIKAKELADALETSERTIYRDIDVLCESGIAIRSIQGPNGGFSFMDDYKIDMKKFNSNDVINLLLCGLGIRPAKYTESALTLKGTILKLESSLPQQYMPDIKIAKERFYFDPAPWWRDINPVVYLDTVRKAVWQSKKVLLKYTKANGELTERIVCPYGLVVKSTEWYLVAFCDTRMGLRVFKCERIENAEILEEGFIIPADFSLEEYWDEWTRKFKESCMQNEKKAYEVNVRIKKENSYLLDGFEVIEKSHQNEFFIATLNLYDIYNAFDRLFATSDRIEILAPDELRESIASKALKIIEMYQK